MQKSFSYIVGAVLVVLGLLFLLDNLGYLDAEWVLNKFWPLLLIIAGLWLVGRRSRWREVTRTRKLGDNSSASNARSEGGSEDHISYSEVFGNIRKEITSRQFRGGECSVVFGDIRLDLSRADLSPGEQVLKFSSVFGNIRLELPRDLEYSIKANFVAGGVTVKGDKRGGLFQSIAVRSEGFAAAEKRLSILASSTFGDIRVL